MYAWADRLRGVILCVEDVQGRVEESRIPRGTGTAHLPGHPARVSWPGFPRPWMPLTVVIGSFVRMFAEVESV